MKTIDKEEIRRLSGKLIADTERQRVNGKRYPWAMLRELAFAWLAANPSGQIAAQTPLQAGKTAAVTPATNEPTLPDLAEHAKGIAEHISAAQADALRTLWNNGHMDGAGKATVGALVNKGLIVVHEDPEDGVDITPLGNAVAAILAAA